MTDPPAEASQPARSRPRRQAETSPPTRARPRPRAERGIAGAARDTWRRLNLEQRAAAVAALLLIASTFGPFSFVEAAIVLTALGVLTLLRQRAEGRRFHLPFGDGTVILAAGTWSALLIVARVFDRELGQSVLALACALVLAGAGARERARRPADDLPAARETADLLAERGPTSADLPAERGPDPPSR